MTKNLYSPTKIKNLLLSSLFYYNNSIKSLQITSDSNSDVPVIHLKSVRLSKIINEDLKVVGSSPSKNVREEIIKDYTYDQENYLYDFYQEIGDYPDYNELEMLSEQQMKGDEEKIISEDLPEFGTKNNIYSSDDAIQVQVNIDNILDSLILTDNNNPENSAYTSLSSQTQDELIEAIGLDENSNQFNIQLKSAFVKSSSEFFNQKWFNFQYNNLNLTAGGLWQSKDRTPNHCHIFNPKNINFGLRDFQNICRKLRDNVPEIETECNFLDMDRNGGTCDNYNAFLSFENTGKPDIWLNRNSFSFQASSDPAQECNLYQYHEYSTVVYACDNSIEMGHHDYNLHNDILEFSGRPINHGSYAGRMKEVNQVDDHYKVTHQFSPKFLESLTNPFKKPDLGRTSSASMDSQMTQFLNQNGLDSPSRMIGGDSENSILSMRDPKMLHSNRQPGAAQRREPQPVRLSSPNSYGFSRQFTPGPSLSSSYQKTGPPSKVQRKIRYRAPSTKALMNIILRRSRLGQYVEKISTHGCWCGYIADSLLGGHSGQPKDSIDSLCRSHHACTNCAKFPPSSCSFYPKSSHDPTYANSPDNIFNQNYVVTYNLATHVWECPDTQDQCLKSRCECDLNFVTSLKDELMKLENQARRGREEVMGNLHRIDNNIETECPKKHHGNSLQESLENALLGKGNAITPNRPGQLRTRGMMNPGGKINDQQNLKSLNKADIEHLTNMSPNNSGYEENFMAKKRHNMCCGSDPASWIVYDSRYFDCRMEQVVVRSEFHDFV